MEESIFNDVAEPDVFSSSGVPQRETLSPSAQRSANVKLAAVPVAHSVSTVHIHGIATVVARWSAAVLLAAGLAPHNDAQKPTGGATWIGSGSEAAVAGAIAVSGLHAALSRRFHQLVESCDDDVAMSSSPRDWIEHPAYQAIIQLGPTALPFIFADLRDRYRPWSVALRRITGENPVGPDDRAWPDRVRSRWLEWGREHGYEC